MHKLFILLLTIPYISLQASSTAADVKAAHAISKSAPTIFPPKAIELWMNVLNRETRSPQNIYRFVSWLRTHPEYRDAQLHKDSMPFIESCTMHVFCWPILQTLIQLNTRPQRSLEILLDNFDDQVYTKPSDHDRSRKIQMQSYIVRDLIDLSLKHNMSFRDIRHLISDKLSGYRSLSATAGDPMTQYVRDIRAPQMIPVLEEALAYVNMLIEEHRTALRSALDPVLLPDLINITIDYAVPVPAEATPPAPVNKPQ